MIYIYICIVLWYHQIIHFSRIFPYEPSILGYPHSRKPPCVIAKGNGSKYFPLEATYSKS